MVTKTRAETVSAVPKIDTEYLKYFIEFDEERDKSTVPDVIEDVCARVELPWRTVYDSVHRGLKVVFLLYWRKMVKC